MKYYIKTFGCQMNYADSERIAAQLEKYGFSPAISAEKADLTIFNSCSVRQTAEDRVFGFIHNIWKKNPQGKIILTGCLANRKDVQKRLKNKVDLFIDIEGFQKEIIKFIACHPELVEGSNFLDSSTSPAKAGYAQNGYLPIKPKYTNNYTAYIPVMTGCNNFCSYCVVPYARGREISQPAKEIIQEIRSLIKQDYKEIILLGQNVNSYCDSSKNSSAEASAKADNTITFSILLKKINAIPGHFWISFISNHPKDFSAELIKTATKLPKVCEYIHLPLQAGDDQILQKMNRHYTSEKYLELIRKIKKSFQKYKPGKLYSLTSDIIVGFPSETKKQFLESAKVMEKVGFDMVYFGQYSPRPQTAAAKLKNNVSKTEKSRREKYLNEILKKTSFTNNQKYLGKTIEVLIDKKADRIPKAKPLESKGLALGETIYFGRTRTMKNVRIISRKNNLIGKFVKAKIAKANIWNLEAKIE